MERIQKLLRRVGLYAAGLGKWLLAAGLIGLGCGLVGAAFHIGVEWVTEYRLAHRWVLYLLPAAGLAVVAIYKLLRVEGKNTNHVLREVQSGEGLPLGLLPAIFFSTVLTHFAGGAAGREGAALQMGGTLGYSTGRLLRLRDKDLRLAALAGMAAFFTALFGTPMAATVFAVGVVSVGLFYHAALLPSLAASLTAYGVSRLLGVEPTHFTVAAPALDALMLLRVAGLAALCAWVSMAFCFGVHGAEHLCAKAVENPWLRAALGGAALLGLTLAVGNTDYNGAGMGVIARAVEQGQASAWAPLLKLLFTAVTLGVGFKGGEVVPSFFVGATFGCLVGPLLGIPAGFAAAVGLIAVFCGAVNAPVASVFLAVELFGADGMLYFALACAVCYVLSGYTGLYSSQRILYDKLRAQFIDVKTNAHAQGETTPAERAHPFEEAGK